MKLAIRKGWLVPLSSSALLALFLGAPVAAQTEDENQGVDWSEWEYEWDEGLHQEEWYDPSDWIDTEEGISYESDWWDYSYDYDPYDYDYGYDLDSDFYEDDDEGVYDDDYYSYDYYTNDWYDDEGVFEDWWE